MRSEEDLKRALRILGASFTHERIRRATWGGVPDHAVCEARGGYVALGWMDGGNNLFADTLEYCAAKLIELAKQNDDQKGDRKND